MAESDPTVAQLQKEIRNLQDRIRELEGTQAEHDRTAQALRESELRLRQTTESLPIVLLSAEAMTNRVLLMIGAVEEIFGYDREQFLEDPLLGATLIHPADQAMVYNTYMSGLSAGQPFEVVYRIIRGKTGETRWIRQCVVPVHGPNGRLIRQDCVILDVTVSKRAEESLQESEARFRLLSEGSLSGVCILRGDVFVYANPAMAQIFGYEPDEIVNKLGPLDLVHEADQPLVSENIRRRLSGEVTAVQYVFRGRRKDGSIVFCEAMGRQIEYQGRQAILGTVMDITEQKRAEKELQFQATVLDQIRDHICVTDLEGRIIYVNEAQARAMEKPRSEIIGRKIAVFGNDPARGPLQDEILQTTLREGEWQCEMTSRSPEGSEVMLACRTWVIRDEKDAPTAICAICTDITGRRQAETALHESERRLRAVAETMPVVLFSVDRTGVIRLCEGSPIRALGTRPQEFVGKNILNLYPEVPEIAANFNRALAGETFTATVTVGGQSFEVWHSPMKEESGRVIGITGVANNVTERNRLQAQLLQSQKLQSIGTLAGGVAHDFGNLLAVIIGNISIVLRQPSISEKSRDLLRDMMDAAERAASLTHQLLAFARGGLQKPSPINLNRHVESILQILRRTAPRGMEFGTSLPADLPQIVADSTQMEQVIMNLCLNAIEASQPPTRIEISTESMMLNDEAAKTIELAPGNYVRLAVQDHGCGMDASTVERVFEPFFTTKPTGRGMGLAATEGIVHSHKGQIRVDSGPGKGTTVSVWLPAVPWETSKQAQPIGRAAELPHGNETVLIVDDLDSAARAAESSLSTLGYCAISHTSLKSAIAFLETNSEDVDIVLLGANILRSTRADPLEEIRKKCPDVPIVVAGRSAGNASTRRLLRRGATAFVQKPFAISSLSQAVRSALDRSPRVRNRETP